MILEGNVLSLETKRFPEIPMSDQRSNRVRVSMATTGIEGIPANGSGTAALASTGETVTVNNWWPDASVAPGKRCMLGQNIAGDYWLISAEC